MLSRLLVDKQPLMCNIQTLHRTASLMIVKLVINYYFFMRNSVVPDSSKNSLDVKLTAVFLDPHCRVGTSVPTSITSKWEKGVIQRTKLG